jgi:PqqD family protein of HPr-rel-A system
MNESSFDERQESVTRLRQLALNRDGFAFDPLTGASFAVNETGIFILERLASGASRERLLEELAAEFEVAAAEAERDLDDFLQVLRTQRLV